MLWKRIAFWTLAILTCSNVIGFLLDGRAAVAGIFISSAVIYCLFVLRAEKRVTSNLIATFIAVETADCLIVIAMGAPLSFLVESWRSTLWHVAAAVFGFVIARSLKESALGKG